MSTACGTWEGCAPATELYTGIPHLHMTLVVVVDAVLVEVVMYEHATDVCSHRKVICLSRCIYMCGVMLYGEL